MSVQLALGLVALGAVLAWILSDWQVRTLRAVALLVLALVVGIGVGYGLNTTWGFAAAAILGGVIALPVLMRHPLVTAMKPADSAMVSQLGDIERRLVAASKDYQSERASIKEYEQLMAAARERVRRIEAPDKEWAGVLREIGREMDATLGVVRGQSRYSTADEIGRRRAFVRHAFRDVVRRRIRH